MDKFRNKYSKKITENVEMIDKTKSLEILYKKFIKKPTLKNKLNWFNKMKGND